jgi:hypothetical protein
VPPEQGPPNWNVYFQTSDADALVKAVQQCGGSVVVRPMDVLGQGRMTVVLDPAGAAFAGWEPGRNKGLDRVSEPGPPASRSPMPGQVAGVGRPE